MSGQSNSGSQTTTQELPGYAQPYAQQILQRAGDLSNQQTPQYSGQLYAGLNGTQNQAISGINNLANSGGYTGQVGQGLVNTANNGGNSYGYQTGQNVTASQNPYASATNPYLDQEVNAANAAVQRAYQQTAGGTAGQFASSGAFGGSAYQQALNNNQATLAATLANNTNNIYNNAYNQAAALSGQQAQLNTNAALANQTNALNYSNLNSNNYNNAQSRALQAGSLASGLDQNTLNQLNAQYQAGTAEQTNNQNQLNSQYQQWYQQAMSPYAQLGILESGLASALGAGAQGITSSSQSPSALGTGLALGQLGLGAGGLLANLASSS